MNKTTQLKQMLLERKALACPGVYDALSARMAEACGFRAVQISGFGFSASSLGMTDASFTSLEEIVHVTANVVRAVSIPVMTDADTGYGNAVNAWWTTRRLEETGAAGMNIEDQCLPKRCGHMDGKQLISLEEMVGKVRAAVDARRDPDFVINARTDACAVCHHGGRQQSGDDRLRTRRKRRLHRCCAADALLHRHAQESVGYRHIHTQRAHGALVLLPGVGQPRAVLDAHQ